MAQIIFRKKVALWALNVRLAMQIFLWAGFEEKFTFPLSTNLSDLYICFTDDIFLIWNRTKTEVLV